MIELAVVASLLIDQSNPMVEREHECLIENAIYEAVGETQRGMQLVTEVVINRLDNGYRGARTFCDVVFSPSQFSWTNIPEDELLTYTDEEYLLASQVVFSLLYDAVDRILPENVLHYLNPRDATDMSWYDPSKVILAYRNHHYLVGVN